MGKKRRAEGGDGNETEKIDVDTDDEGPVDVKPIGDVIKRSNKGKAERTHYESVELDGVRYDLGRNERTDFLGGHQRETTVDKVTIVMVSQEDAVLVAPERRGEKPYVAIIKEIKQATDGTVAVTGQWFYRPEEAAKKGGGSWTSFDSRELFYSFHRDEVPAESVMHRCVVHFIPPQKQPPARAKHPGFIIRQVYDTVEKKLWKLTDKDYEDSKQKEIDLLVQKTREALGDLEDIEDVETSQVNDAEEVDKNKRQGRRKIVPPINVIRDDSIDIMAKGDVPLSTKVDSTKVDTPSSCETPGSGFPSDIMDLLRSHNSLTGQTARDRWLGKIVKGLKCVLDTVEPKPSQTGEAKSNQQQDLGSTVHLNIEPQALGAKDGDGMQKEEENLWPTSAISVVSALERLAHEFNGSDVHKYNLKMRQLDFNLKANPVLARRLLRKELEAATVYHMTPVELKDGFTAAEKKAREPPQLETLQMISARCKICGEREVGLKDIIHVGSGDRYQLECLKCGNSWYASRDSVSSVTTEDQVNTSPAVGLAPWATSKFEEIEKELHSPRDSERPSVTQESSASLQTKPEEAQETNAPESHYVEVERILTEHISLPGPDGQDQSKVDGVLTGESTKEHENASNKSDQADIGDPENRKKSREMPIDST